MRFAVGFGQRGCCPWFVPAQDGSVFDHSRMTTPHTGKTLSSIAAVASAPVYSRHASERSFPAALPRAPDRVCRSARVCTALAYAAHAHVHGNATLEVAIDTNLTVSFRARSIISWVSSVLRARIRKKRLCVQTMERLRKPEELFVPSAAARCTRIAADVYAPVLEAPYKAPKGEHAALAARSNFAASSRRA